MAIKYVPVLRWRDQELNALAALTLPQDFLPLVEIIKEKPRTNMKGSFVDIYGTKLAQLDIPAIIDFPSSSATGGTAKAVQDFLRPLQLSPLRRIPLLSSLTTNTKLIPTVTYTPIKGVPLAINEQVAGLRIEGRPLAFRLFPGRFSEALKAMRHHISAADYVLLDIDEMYYDDPILRSIYVELAAVRRDIKCQTVLIRAAIPAEKSNLKLDNGKQILEADNGLRGATKRLGFSAFGDYVGVKRDLPGTGGVISPGFIFFSPKDDFYVGFRGILNDATSFLTTMLPSITGSAYVKALSSAHVTACPGCAILAGIQAGTVKASAQPIWKGISLQHYLYSMVELLK